MFNFKPATRLALSVGMLASALLWIALSLGLLPNPRLDQFTQRINVARHVALVTTAYIGTQKKNELTSALDSFVDTNPHLVSVGIRRSSGSILAGAGPHEEAWKPQQSSTPHPDQISADLLANDQSYGTLELVFTPIHQTGLAGWLAFPVQLTLFMSSALALLSWVLFARSFKYLNPSRVVPSRVRSAFDTMAEGLVLLDTSAEIAHANHAFSEIVQADADSLVGKAIDSFQWMQSADFGSDVLPWTQCLEEHHPVCGAIIELTISDQPGRKFMVNASPIMSDAGGYRGVLISFDDVTDMEKKKFELSQMIQTLRQSRDEVERKNKKLNYFASFDQLTGCMNRREFFRQYETLWAADEQVEIGLLMFDIDHFKAVNDNHGHGTGDEVLKTLGKLLREVVGDVGTVVRMGGEEFTILLPGFDIAASEQMGETINAAIRGQRIASLKITASIGVSTRAFKAMDPQHLLDQADEALYVAKNGGRDRVVRYDLMDQVEQVQQETDADAFTEFGVLEHVEALVDFSCQATRANENETASDTSIPV